MASTFEDMPVASWSVRNYKVTFPISAFRESGGNRIVARQRPYRDGAKLDDTGSNEVRWTVTAIFENSVEEPGLSNSGLELYPDVMNKLLESFSVHETGDLVLPPVGKRRARAQAWERVENPELQNGAEVVLTFVEDNEDAVTSESFKQPTARGNARRLAETTTFDHESVDNGHFSIADLEQAVSDLEGLVNAPFDYAQDVEVQARRVAELAKRVVAVFSVPGVRGRESLSSPQGNRADRKMVRATDMAARSTNEAGRGRPQLVRYRAQRDTSLFVVSAYLRQSYVDLLAANPQLEDPAYLPKGTEVRVFAATGELR